MARIVCIGEAMLELSHEDGHWQLGYGGDTLNTAIHLARKGHGVAFLTALGADPFSDEMKRRWEEEGLDLSLVLTHPTRQPGLYAITTDATGERSFTYWREASAAREMFALPGLEARLAAAERAELLYFSLITLATLPPRGRKRLLALARRVGLRGGRVAFDGNYRPRLWSSSEEAAAVRDAAVACADIGLPTLDDELLLNSSPSRPSSGGPPAPDGSEVDVGGHWARLGCVETIVKLGARGCLLPDGRIIAPERTLKPVDTSGAGDAFNAGYLAARLNGDSIAQAARRGHALAGRTIMRRGAIPAVDQSEA